MAILANAHADVLEWLIQRDAEVSVDSITFAVDRGYPINIVRLLLANRKRAYVRLDVAMRHLRTKIQQHEKGVGGEDGEAGEGGGGGDGDDGEDGDGEGVGVGNGSDDREILKLLQRADQMAYETLKARDGNKPNTHMLIGTGAFGTVFRFVDEHGLAYAVKTFSNEDEAYIEMTIIKDMLELRTNTFTLFENVEGASESAKPTCGLVNAMPTTAPNRQGKCTWCDAVVNNRHVDKESKVAIQNRYAQSGYHFHIIMPAFDGDGIHLFKKIKSEEDARLTIAKQCKVLCLLLGYIETLTFHTSFVAYDMKLQNVLYKLETGNTESNPHWLDDVITQPIAQTRVRVALSDYGGFCSVDGFKFKPKATFVNRTADWGKLQCSKWFNAFVPVVLMLQSLQLEYEILHYVNHTVEVAINNISESATSTPAEVTLANIVVRYWSELNTAFAADKSSEGALRFMKSHPAYRLMREQLMSLAYN